MKTKLKLALIYAIVAGFSLTLAVSCGNKKSPDIKAQEDSVATKPKTDTVKLVSSLEELYSYSPRYTVIEKCDLSHLGLKEIPAVWLYNIKKLDLSHNDLRFFDAYDFLLPKSIEELNISYCNIGRFRHKDFSRERMYIYPTYLVKIKLNFKEKDFPHLKKLNASYNRIRELKVPEYTEVADTNYNKCRNIVNKVRANADTNKTIRRDTVKLVKSLEALYELAPNTVIETCDLSGQGLTKLPVLRPYNIIRLDISDNDFSNLSKEEATQERFIAMLPESLVELDMSNCHYCDSLFKARKDEWSNGIEVVFSKAQLPNIRNINIQGNSFCNILFTAPVEQINAARNNLLSILIYTKTVKYLDVSYNWKMHNAIGIQPQSIETIKRDSCARGKELIKKEREVTRIRSSNTFDSPVYLVGSREPIGGTRSRDSTSQNQ